MSGRFDRLRRQLDGVSQLFGASGETRQEPEGRSQTSTEFYSIDHDVSRPDDVVNEFYEEYEANPFIARPVDAIVEEVFEPGWWITADSEQTVDEVTEFCHNLTIAGGRTHQGLTDFGRLASTQHLVRGTFLAEKMVNNDGQHVGLNPLKTSTVEAYTKPNQGILLPPDWNGGDDGTSDVKYTDDNQVAAFIQYDEAIRTFDNRPEQRFARNEVLHWPRNPDVGDVFGQSVVKPVYNRAKALRQKLADNDDAIAMKAWPMVLFRLGTPERPWTDDQQEDFMKSYDSDELGPGMYQGVPGDVEIEEFAGETADIEEHVRTDVNYIVAGMPGPKFTLGTFDEDIADSVAKAQERRYKKTVRELRRSLEELLTPYLRTVAKSWGEEPSGLQLHIGRPKGEVAPEDVNGSTIRYTSDADNAKMPDQSLVGDEDDSDESEATPSREATNRSPEPDSRSQRGPSVSPDGAEASVTDPDISEEDASPAVTELLTSSLNASSWRTAELSDPRLVSTRDEERALSDGLSRVLKRAQSAVVRDVERASTIDELDPDRLRRRAVQAGRDERAASNLTDAIEGNFTDVVSNTLATLDQQSHTPQLSRSFRRRHRELVDRHAGTLTDEVDELLAEFGRQLARQVETAQNGAGSIETAVDRVTDVYSESELDRRASLFTRMHATQLVNQTKLDEYERTDEIVGVTLTNPCTQATTDLCRDLACGDETSTALFDTDAGIGEQLASGTDVEPADGFDPLTLPPYHYNCRTELVPVTRDDE